MSTCDDVIAHLDALVETTGVPPDDPEPEAVLAAYHAISEARRVLLAGLSEIAPLARADVRLAARALELATREHAWVAVLERARELVDQRLAAARRAGRRQA